MSGVVQALAPVVLATPAEPVTVQLDIADALGVGLSLQCLARGAAMPRDTREKYERVGKQLVAAARAAAGTVGR